MKKKLTLLVIEDDALLLLAISKKLTLLGVGVVSATTGAQALDYMANLTKLPDAIWLDYYLPDITGLDFVQAVKNNSRWAKIPIVVVSNSATKDKIDHMLALGVNKYLLKAGYRLDQIIDIISQMAAKGGKK